MATARNHLRALVAALAVALVAAGCGSDVPDGYAQADAVLDAIGQDRDAAVADIPADCTRTVAIDEYGFETEVLDCPPGADPAEPASAGDLASLLAGAADLPVGTFDDVVADLDPSPVKDRLVELGALLDQLDRTCGSDIAAWRGDLGEVADATAALQAALETPPPGLDSTTEGAAIGRALVERVVLQTGCGTPGVAAAVGEDQLIESGTIDVTARAATVVQDVEQRLSGSPQRFLFYLYSEIQYGWMRTQRDPLDLVVLGSSQAGDAADLAALSTGLGARVGNAFLPGALAEVQQHWLPEVERLTDPGAAVWYLGALDLLADCSVANRADDFVRRQARLQRSFAPSGWFRTIDPVTTVLGPVGPQDELLGEFPKQPDPIPEAIAAQTESYTPQVADASFCSERAEVIGDSIRSLIAAGTDVYVVGVPTSPLFVDLVDGGAEAVHGALDQLVDFLPDEAQVIDLTGAVQDDLDHWRDLTHMTASGSLAFSTAVIAALDDVGFAP